MYVMYFCYTVYTDATQMLHALQNADRAAAGLFDSHEVAGDRLCPALMQVFVDCEHTGTDSQFYDKVCDA